MSNPLEIRPPWDIPGGLIVFAAIAILGCLIAASGALWLLGYLDPLIRGSAMGPRFEVSELVAGLRGLETARPVPAPHRALIYLAAALPLPLAAWVAWLAARPPEKLQHVEGRQLVSPALLARREKADIKRTGAGLQVGEFCYSMSRETTHTSIIGGTGSGKTTVIEPLIEQAFRRGDKIITLDVKGDFTARLPLEPILIAPWDSRSWAWNVGRDVVGPAGAAQLAFDLVGEGEGANSVFRDSARLVLTGILILIMADKGKNWGWPDLANEIAKIGRDGGAALAARFEKEYPQARGALAEGKTRASILMDLAAKMQIVHQLAAAWKSSKKQFSIRRYISYLAAPSQRIRPVVIQASQSFGHLSRALTASMIGALRGAVLSPNLSEVPPNGGAAEGSRRIWLFLDEVGQIGPGAAEAVVSLAEVGRSKGFRLVIGAQSWSQIEEDLGREGASSLAAVINTWLIGRQGGGAPGGEKWASELIGKRRVSRLVGTLGDGGAVTYHRHEEEVQVLRPEFFGQGGKLGADKNGARMVLLTSDPSLITVPRGLFTERRPPSVPAPWTLGPDNDDHDKIDETETTPAPASAGATPTTPAQQRAIAPPEAEQVAEIAAASAAPAPAVLQQQPEPETTDQEQEAESEAIESEAIAEIAEAVIGEAATGGICTAIEATAEAAGLIENTATASDIAQAATQPTQLIAPAQPEADKENPLNKLKRRVQQHREREHDRVD
jgi:hypothetical protein